MQLIASWEKCSSSISEPDFEQLASKEGPNLISVEDGPARIRVGVRINVNPLQQVI